MRTLWHGADRPFRLAAALVRDVSILADRRVGIHEAVRNVVHARGENISALPSSLTGSVSTRYRNLR